jgi:hypothetical protein
LPVVQLQQIPANATVLTQLQEVNTRVDKVRVGIQQMELNPAEAAAAVSLAAAADVVRFQAVPFKTVAVAVDLVSLMRLAYPCLKLLTVKTVLVVKHFLVEQQALSTSLALDSVVE